MKMLSVTTDIQLHTDNGQLRLSFPLTPCFIRYAVRQLLEEHAEPFAPPLTNKDRLHTFLRANMANQEPEAYCLLLLDNHKHVIAFEPLLTGTVDQAGVVREVVTRALTYHASFVGVARHHPSGNRRLRDVDRRLTQALIDALYGVDIQWLDYWLITGHQVIRVTP